VLFVSGSVLLELQGSAWVIGCKSDRVDLALEVKVDGPNGSEHHVCQSIFKINVDG
jgi:hypothetical protein